MSARPPGGTCPALAHRSLLCQSTTVCSSKRWTCRGGSSPRTRGAARGSIRPRGRRAPPAGLGIGLRVRGSRQPPQPALTDLKEPDRPDEAQFAMRALHRALRSPAADQPRSTRSSAICEVRSGLLPGSGGPQDVDQRSPCPPAHRAECQFCSAGCPEGSPGAWVRSTDPPGQGRGVRQAQRQALPRPCREGAYRRRVPQVSAP
jgi:hypothetical protein